MFDIFTINSQEITARYKTCWQHLSNMLGSINVNLNLLPESNEGFFAYIALL
jgi:hypothetical protein